MRRPYLTEVGDELTKAGIRGRLRARILAELTDHLESDPGADLGDPARLARQFADELGTSRARTAAISAFAALALAGSCAAALVLSVAASGGAGGIGDDPFDGAPRGLLEGSACLAGFATFGRYLGLRA
jgi:hypothetical protein